MENDTLKKATLTRIRDLLDFQITLDLFAFDSPEKKFDTSIFYQKIRQFQEDTESVSFNSVSKFDEFKSLVKRKEKKKRSLFRIPFNLHNNLEIGVKGFYYHLSY